MSPPRCRRGVPSYDIFWSTSPLIVSLAACMSLSAAWFRRSLAANSSSAIIAARFIVKPNPSRCSASSLVIVASARCSGRLCAAFAAAILGSPYARAVLPVMLNSRDLVAASSCWTVVLRALRAAVCSASSLKGRRPLIASCVAL